MLDGFKIHNKYKELGGLGLLINPTEKELEHEKQVGIKLKEFIMEKQVKELRVTIDGLSQLVKELKSFEIITAITEQVSLSDKDNYGAIESVPNNFSSTNQRNKFHHLVKTDRGTFRWTTCDKWLKLYDIDLKSKEINKSYDSLILAKAWLGKVLAELGTVNPYKSGYKTKEDIEPTADTNDKTKNLSLGENPIDRYSELNHIEKADWLRTKIEELVIKIKELNFLIPSRELSIARTNAYNYLCESKFWLGFELQRIKKEK